ncbi:MAG TPA: sulfatase-like hydrolase/transferase, partial [Bryobacteraceae bacterium]|nr:sulfatase-like hydrolase/transferase [Bryobacteraceae bacterium]
LDQLAKQGVRFERAYSAYPLSGPARAALITGRFPHACGVTRNGVRLPLDQPSIAAELRSAGYQTGFVGEWGLDGPDKSAAVPPGPRRHGFDTWAAGSPESTAIDFLKQTHRNPFFLFLAPAESASIDSAAGRLLRALDEQRLATDTIVLFTSAYGANPNLPFERSVRVPLIVRYPRRLPGGRSIDALISNVDIMPTLLALCGVDIPRSVQGRNLAAWIMGGSGERPESIYSTGKVGSPGEWRMVVRGLDKLVVNSDLDVTHLYNLGADPSEMDNLAHDPVEVLKRDELEALLKDWMRRTGDRMDPSGLQKRG